MHLITQLPYCWCVMLALLGAVERENLGDKVRSSHQIQNGMSEDAVIAILGEPTLRWPHPPLTFWGNGMWMYGTSLDVAGIINPDWPFPNPIPIKLRLFAPDDADLVVYWNNKQEVELVKRPHLR